MSTDLGQRGETVEVKCYSGFKGEEIPRFVKLEGSWYEIVKVIRIHKEENVKNKRRKTNYKLLTKSGEKIKISLVHESRQWILD